LGVDDADLKLRGLVSANDVIDDDAIDVDPEPSKATKEASSAIISLPKNIGVIGSIETPLYSWTCLYITSAMGILSFFSGWLWYLSLPLTAVATNTTIYQCAAVFVYLLSVPLLGEAVTLPKVAAVLTSLTGVALIAFSTEDGSAKNDNSLAGILLVLSTTLCYSIYEVLFKLVGPDEGSETVVEDSIFVFGLIGLTSVFLVWPGLLLVHWTGFERFELPPLEILELFVLNGLMDAVFNIMLVLGIALTTPLFVTCGTMLAIPASLVWDHLAHGSEPNAMAWAGVSAVVAGFILLNLRVKSTVQS